MNAYESSYVFRVWVEKASPPDVATDVQSIPVLRHRVSTNFQAQAEGLSTEDVIERLLREIPTPEIPKFAG